MKLPQLSLRDLFWLVLVAACLCGWWREARSTHNKVEAESRKRQETFVAFFEFLRLKGFQVDLDSSGRAMIDERWRPKETIDPAKYEGKAEKLLNEQRERQKFRDFGRRLVESDKEFHRLNKKP